ncbi:MAG: hypothetical protein ACHQQQ_06045 [Bacteroidota bacterium]
MRFRHSLHCICVAVLMSMASNAIAGPPFKTDDPQPVDYLHWEFYVASEQEFQTHSTGATCPHFEVNYGVVPNVQLHVVAPLGYVHTANGTHYGYSDTEFGFKYRFVGETGTVPQIGVFPLIEIPTGNENEQLGAGKAQIYLPAWVQKTWGKLTTYAGGGIWYNPGASEKNSLFTGWEAQYDFSEVITLGGEVFYQTADGQGMASSTGFNLGGYINASENHHLLFSLGRSLSGESTITGYIGYQLTI